MVFVAECGIGQLSGKYVGVLQNQGWLMTSFTKVGQVGSMKILFNL